MEPKKVDPNKPENNLLPEIDALSDDELAYVSGGACDDDDDD